MYSFVSFAEVAVGITANFASIETDGSETLRDSANVTKASVSEEMVLPEVFIESVEDWGAMGLAWIPAQELGSKSRSDTNSDGDTGTYKAEAEISSHILIYINANFAEAAGHTMYAIGGLSVADITTSESLNSGSSYGDEDVLGFTVGLGAKADLGDSMFYKLEGTYTDYDTYDESSANNKIQAETEVTSVKVGIGYKF